MRSAEERVGRAVARKLLTAEQGELLLRILSYSALLDFSVRSELTSLVIQIADEMDAGRRRKRLRALAELVAATMPTTYLSARLTRAFGHG